MMEVKNLSSVTALMVPCVAFLLVLCLTCMWFVTILEAKGVQDDWEQQLDATLYGDFYNSFAPSYQPAAVDRNRLPLIEKLATRLIDYRKNVDTAMAFFQDDKQVIDSNYYGHAYVCPAADWYDRDASRILDSIRYITQDGYSRNQAIRMDLDAFFNYSHPILETLQREGTYRANSFIRIGGYQWDDQTFVPVRLDVLDSDPAWISLQKGQTLSKMNSKGMLNWTTLCVNGKVEKTKYREIICQEIQYKSSVSLNTYYRNDQALMDVLIDDSYNTRQNADLSNTLIVRTASLTASDGTVYEVRAAISGNPLVMAMKKLVVIYLLSLAVFAGLCIMCRVLLEQRLERPFQQVVDIDWNNLTANHAPYWGRWDDIISVQQNYLHAQQVLQSLRQENKRLETALSYAENAEINRRQMVSNITHELKTPLTVIRSYCEGLQAGIAPEKQEKYLNVIVEEVDQIDAMVLEMLDLSRLEAGKVRLEQNLVELLGLTQGIIDKLQPLLDAKSLSVHFSNSQKSLMIADEGRIEQVITNLTTNAIKYSPEGGKVVISVLQRNGFTLFSIENESPPLSEEALEKVWENFYRTEQSRTTKGTGLGLSICKAIIELHRGSCQVENTVTGVRFSFMLPG